MARLTPIVNMCIGRDCKNVATVRLWDSCGSMIGDYCLACGHVRLNEQQRLEDSVCRPPKSMPPLVTE